MKLWDRIKTAIDVVQGKASVWPGGLVMAKGVTPDIDTCEPWVPNPYLEEGDAEAIYETLENGIHAVWPLLNANEQAGVLAARGVVWGALYSFTLDEDAKDQNGMAWELARLIQEYLPSDQDPMDLPGVRMETDNDWFDELTKEQTPGVHMIRGEMCAFLDAAISGNYQGASNVAGALRSRLGAISYRNGGHESVEEAEKLIAINFLGSCLASVATKYAEDEIERGDDE